VLEPLARIEDGRWQLWYLSAEGEVGPGEQPDYRIEYVESVDGLSGWSAPEVVFTTADGFFDNDVRRVDGHHEMLVARGTNLHGTPDYPTQGVWWLRSASGAGARRDWSATPLRLLDTDADPLPWFAAGVCGPSFHYGDTEADRDTLYVFCTGTSARIDWPRAALRRVLKGRLPPVPSPYYLATGRLAFPRPEASQP
jgi:hypothetical protein